MNSQVELSIIISSYNSKKTIANCLDSLRSQRTDRAFEVIVVDSSQDGTADLVRDNHSWVRVKEFQDRKYCGDARNVGVSLSKAKIVAFIDADCVAESNWVDEIIKAHQSSYLAIGGSIANGNPSSYVGWAAYFCEFSAWMPGQCPRWMTDIAGANMSYKKEVFEKCGKYIGGTYCSDTEFHWRLRRGGHQLRFEPAILIYHNNISKLGRFISHEFGHGRFFAQVRSKYQGFPLWRRFLYAFFWPFLALKLLVMVILNCIRSKKHMFELIRCMPLLILGLLSWCLGECSGYLSSRIRRS